MAISHEGDKIASAVNRYFGFFLVGNVRLSAEPFTPSSARAPMNIKQPSQSDIAKIGAQVADIADDDVREALRTLGIALASKAARKNK
jgi:hypothetical protein